MSAASNQTENDIINALLRGVALTVPTKTYVALHTADPTDAGGVEVDVSAWPSYVRREAEQGGAIGSGWSAPSDGISRNSKQLTYPSYNGTGDITITHWSVFYESSAGTMRIHAPLDTPRTLSPGDVLVFDINALTIQQS